MEKTVNSTLDEITRVVTTYGLDVIAAVVILIIGWIAANWGARIARRTMEKAPKVDQMLAGFISGLVKYSILVFTILAVLAQFGIQTTSFIAVLGAAGLAVGLALQGTLSNVASGVMLLIFRPFKVGDFVEGGGVTGVIDSVSLFVTEMHTPDNIHIIIPNSQLWNTPIRNYSYHDTRRVDYVFGIAYEDGIDGAMDIIKTQIAADNRVLKDPEPMVVVGELADSSVNLIVRVWCVSGDYWPVKFELTKAIKEALDGGGITIPYPQHVVHMPPQAPAQAAE